jgi:hypothetical protein
MQLPFRFQSPLHSRSPNPAFSVAAGVCVAEEAARAVGRALNGPPEFSAFADPTAPNEESESGSTATLPAEHMQALPLASKNWQGLMPDLPSDSESFDSSEGSGAGQAALEATAATVEGASIQLAVGRPQLRHHLRAEFCHRA